MIVIEDNKNMKESILQLLNGAELKTEAVSNYEDFKNLLKSNCAGVYLFDCHFPIIPDGNAEFNVKIAIEKVRKAHQNPKIILYSSTNGLKLYADIFKVDYMSKDEKALELLNKIKSLLKEP